MQESNEKKLENLLSANGGYITRKQVDSHGIPSWFLTDFVRKQRLVKIDKGFYAQEQWIRDDYLVFQYKYPKFIFSHVSALFLHGLTNQLPAYFEVTGPKNYRPFSPKPYIRIPTTNPTDLGFAKSRLRLGIWWNATTWNEHFATSSRTAEKSMPKFSARRSDSTQSQKARAFATCSTMRRF